MIDDSAICVVGFEKKQMLCQSVKQYKTVQELRTAEGI